MGNLVFFFCFRLSVVSAKKCVLFVANKRAPPIVCNILDARNFQVFHSFKLAEQFFFCLEECDMFLRGSGASLIYKLICAYSFMLQHFTNWFFSYTFVSFLFVFVFFFSLSYGLIFCYLFLTHTLSKPYKYFAALSFRKKNKHITQFSF